jgi:hypothetical protein
MDKMKDLKAEFDYSEYGGAPILHLRERWSNARFFQR